jgi:thiamine biosynthesis protein ThiS
LRECFFSFGGVKMEVLKINGVEKQFPAKQLPSTITELLESLGVKAATVAAEVDGEIIDRTKFTETKLHNGQSIELVRFVGGG